MQDHAEDAERAHGGGEHTALNDLSRWLAAASYLFCVCLFVMYEVRQNRRDDFVRFHARQGFVLCFAEVVLLIISFILDASVGTIPVLGAIIMITYKLLFGLLSVGLSVWGFVEALAGERWELPLFASWARRVPLG